MGERVVSRLQTRVVGMERAAVFVVVAAHDAFAIGQVDAEYRHPLGRPLAPPCRQVDLPGAHPAERHGGAIARLAVAQARFDGAEF